MQNASQVSRYHPFLVTLHWLTALLILGMLAFGFFVLARWPNTDPAKLTPLAAHMATGMFILLIMIVRFITRLVTKKPPTAPTGSARLDRFATLTHYLFYIVVLMMIGSGWYTGFLISGVFDESTGERLPASFGSLPSFRVHAVLAFVLVALIALHVAGALYHQFVKRDGLFRRMWFGQRSSS
jgi:cytochrome b561